MQDRRKLLDGFFTYQPPKGEDILTYQNIREMAKRFAAHIENHCPDNPDKEIALTKLRETVMWANSSIACQYVWKGDISETVV